MIMRMQGGLVVLLWTVTILSLCVPPGKSQGAIFEFTQQVYNFPEATSTAVAVIRLAANSAVLSSTVRITVSTPPIGTATASLDFTASFSTLTFPAGSRPLLDTQPFNVPVMSDDLPENTESIVVLAEIDGGVSVGTFTPGGNTAEINIIDDDTDVVRLISEVGRNSPTAGRLEIFINNTWGTVCDDLFDIREANVACGQLGFSSGAISYSNARELGYTSAAGPIWLDDLRCSIDDISLRACSNRGTGVHNCIHGQDVILSCLDEGSLRLSSSSATTTLTPSGRLEVYINGRWGTVCSNGFSDTSATVVCEQLGFNNVEGWTTIGSQSEFPSAPRGTEILLDNLGCSSADLTLLSCSHDGVGVHNCSHSQDVAVFCENVQPVESTTVTVTLTSTSEAATTEIPESSSLAPISGGAAGGIASLLFLICIICICASCTRKERRRRSRVLQPAPQPSSINVNITTTTETISEDFSTPSRDPPYSRGNIYTTPQPAPQIYLQPMPYHHNSESRPPPVVSPYFTEPSYPPMPYRHNSESQPPPYLSEPSYPPPVAPYNGGPGFHNPPPM